MTAREGRSPAYPFIPLRKALERAEQLWKAEGKHAVPLSSVYRAWSLGEKGSFGRQTLAALKYFGLVKYEGKGAGRRTRLSGWALNILLDKRPDSPERDELIRDTALKPLIYAVMWREWGAGLPSDATIETYLIRDCGFSESAAPDLIASYKDTIEFAKLSEPAKMPHGDEAPVDEAEDADEMVQTSSGEELSPLATPKPGGRHDRYVPLAGERTLFSYHFEPAGSLRLIVDENIDIEKVLHVVETLIKVKREELKLIAKLESAHQSQDDGEENDPKSPVD